MIGYVIAASNTPAFLKARADAICDGTADEVEINSGLALADTVVLLEGTYTLANSIILGNNQHLSGSGRNTLVKITGAVANKYIIRAVGSLGSELLGVSVTNLRIQGYGDDAGVTLDHGIYFSYVNYGQLANIWAHDCTFSAVQLNNCKHGAVSDVIVEEGSLGSNGGWYGISANNSSLADKSAYHTIVNITTFVSEHGVSLNECDDCVVQNVACQGITNDYAVNFTACQRCVLDGFTLEDCDGGFFLEQNGGGTRTCDRITVSNGILTGTAGTQYGVLITDAPNTVIQNVILNMTGQTAGHGIKIDADSDYSAVRGCKVYDAFDKGILIENGAQYVEISGNDVRECTGRGIEAGTGEYARIFGNHTENNNVGLYIASKYYQCFGNIAIGSGSDGIQVAYADDGNVMGNVCRGNTGYGINVTVANSDRNMLFGNQLTGNTGGTLSDRGTTTYAFRNGGIDANALTELDGITAPGALAGRAIIYVDTADGDLKVKFADGFTATLAADS